MKKKKITFILIGLLILFSVVVFTLPINKAEADNTATYNPSDIVNMRENNDLQRKINDLQRKINDLGSIYTSGGTWGTTYSFSIAPLISSADKKQTDYNTLNTNLGFELDYNNDIYNYWLSKETLKVYEDNMNLAKKTYDIAQFKYTSGTISQNELLSEETSYNNASMNYQDKLAEFEQSKYDMNTKIGNETDASIDINTPDFSFIDKSELDINTVLPNILITHKSLTALNAYLAAYDKARAIASQQDTGNISAANIAGIINYFNERTDLVNLEIQQKKDSIKQNCYTYVSKLNALQNDINVSKQNLDILNSQYNISLSAFSVGKITSQDIDTTRNSILTANLNIVNAEQKYMAVKEEYMLFKQGYLSGGQSQS